MRNRAFWRAKEALERMGDVDAAVDAWFKERDDRVRQLADRFRQLQVARFPTPADKKAALGEVLRGAKKLLPKQYLPWVRKELKLSPKTAENYAALARMVEQFPDLPDAWKQKPLSELYRLAARPPEEREALLRSERKRGSRTRPPADLPSPSGRGEGGEGPSRESSCAAFSPADIHRLIRDLTVALATDPLPCPDDLRERKRLQNELDRLIRLLHQVRQRMK